MDFATRPMYRDDILFGGNLSKISLVMTQKSEDPISEVQTRILLTRVPLTEDRTHTLYHSCSKHFINALKILFDFSLFKSKTFVLLAISTFLFGLSGLVPVMFLMDRASTYNYSTDESKWLVSTVGLASTVGRLIAGAITYFELVDLSMLMSFTLIINGLSTIITGARPDDPLNYQMIYSVIHGLCNSKNYLIK
jgi:hypothetical protein